MVHSRHCLALKSLTGRRWEPAEDRRKKKKRQRKPHGKKKKSLRVDQVDCTCWETRGVVRLEAEEVKLMR